MADLPKSVQRQLNTLSPEARKRAERELPDETKAIVKAPEYLRGKEKQVADAMVAMVSLMMRIYRNQVLLALNKSTIDKFEFEDAQTGNYANIFMKLSKRAARKLVKRFDEKRIKAMLTALLNDVDERNKDVLYARVAKSIGVESESIAFKQPKLSPEVNALIIESTEWTKKLRDETLEKMATDTLRNMTLGRSLDDIIKDFDGLVEKRKNHAQFIARNQVVSFNSLLTNVRARELGVRHAIWKTSQDKRVRECHKARDGRVFTLSKGCYASCDGKWLLPGTDYNCRCTYELIIPEDETKVFK